MGLRRMIGSLWRPRCIVIEPETGDVADLLGLAEGDYLVPRNPEAFATRMVEVCRKGTRSRGREWIARLSMPNVARQIVEVYAGLRQETGT